MRLEAMAATCAFAAQAEQLRQMARLALQTPKGK